MRAPHLLRKSRLFTPHRLATSGLLSAALALSALAMGCDTQNPAASANAGDVEGEPRGGDAEGDGDDAPSVDSTPGAYATGDDGSRVDRDPGGAGTGGGDVKSCTTDADCEGGLCEGLGCGPGMGHCVARERTCTADLISYCGCDGKTFNSSGTCAKQRYAYKGECKDPQPAGSPCTTGAQCESGSCIGDGLEGCGADDHGTCADKAPMCTRDLRPYCGCDGVTFRSSGSCPGQSFRHKGACKG